MDFGFTNDEKVFRSIQTFKEDAIKDGWEVSATYAHESISRAASLSKDDFKMFILTREETSYSDKWKYEAKINIWGPDRLAIQIPNNVYSWSAIQEGTRHCHFCNTKGVTVSRVGFANRACKNCLAEAKIQLEYPGWCD